ncbi:MAG: hypothetical protein GY756_22695 [bacterium]|nr:hypothetical protein [bacterium]
MAACARTALTTTLPRINLIYTYVLLAAPIVRTTTSAEHNAPPAAQSKVKE